MNNLNHKDVGGTEHVSRAKDPAIVEESQKPINWQCRVPRLIAVALCVIFVVVLVRDHIKKAEAKAEAAKVVAAQKATNTPTASSVEALVLVYEGYTPCSSFVGWGYKILWGDYPLRITYSGGEVVDRLGDGADYKAPKTFEPGEASFVSLDSQHPHFRVLVYKKITVQEGR